MKLQNVSDGESFLREACGKILSGGVIYLVPNSTNRNRNSD